MGPFRGALADCESLSAHVEDEAVRGEDDGEEATWRQGAVFLHLRWNWITNCTLT